jgi:uncharacterized protein YdhG (YjbR/CyaY superfamily)
MAKTKTYATNVDDYLAIIPDDAQVAIEKLRKIIRSVIPDAIESISYGIVVFKDKGKGLVGLGATENYCSFYLMSTTIIPAHKDELKSYDTTKGTIHFQAHKPIPSTLVKKLVKARIAESEVS